MSGVGGSPTRRPHLSESLPPTRTVFLQRCQDFVRRCCDASAVLEASRVRLGSREWVPRDNEECDYLTLAEEIGQALLGPWDPVRYMHWRFGTRGIEQPENELAAGIAGHPWLQVAQRIRDPFLRCYRGIYGPVGLYWLLPLLGAMHLFSRRPDGSPPDDEPSTETRAVRCRGGDRGVLLCNGVRLPCARAAL